MTNEETAVTSDETVTVAGRLVRPTRVEGTVLDVDWGYPSSIVVTVESDGERYYETYELAAVESDGERYYETYELAAVESDGERYYETYELAAVERDELDATAESAADGECVTFPDDPPTDAEGLPTEIVAPERP
ncbi:hypothetical protein M0R89_01835 [Halorussus limi]|uniref:Uncharacterized protein n=1 Tax=Halorussus limi TaxID=2938695 RepID=A0A8U0HVQ7_9EURY|nr:hypothetical protein [Halorussus limi]UPV74823.1 hypothetical protein M0R89_01835 [Halorussus limi]